MIYNTYHEPWRAFSTPYIRLEAEEALENLSSYLDALDPEAPRGQFNFKLGPLINQAAIRFGAIEDPDQRAQLQGRATTKLLSCTGEASQGHLDELFGLYETDDFAEVIARVDQVAKIAPTVELDTELTKTIAAHPSIAKNEIIMALASRIETCRQDPEVRQAVAQATVKRSVYGMSAREASSFDFQPQELSAAADKVTRAELNNRQQAAADPNLPVISALQVLTRYEAGPEVTQYVSDRAKHIDLKRLVPFLSSGRLATSMPELHQHVLEGVRREMPQSSDLCVAFMDRLRPSQDAPWLRELVMTALQDPAAREYTGTHLQGLSNRLPNFDEVCALYDIDATRLDLIPADTIAPDKYTFSPEKAQLAGFINRLQWDKLRPDDEQLQAGLSPAAREFITQLPGFVNVRLQALAAKMELQRNIPDRDRRSVLPADSDAAPDVPPLNRTAEALLARYIANVTQGSVEKLNKFAQSNVDIQTLQDEMHKATQEYLDAYTDHIPHYDKAYECFDNLRQGGAQPKEIYLGRDGVYAYFGRQAQRGARIRDGKAETVPELKYLVYNREHVAHLSGESKREYLADNEILDEPYPVFYDTGFMGNIPQDILQVMGLDEATMDQLIFMLSADSDRRRLPNLPDSLREEIVSRIEDGVKDEQSALGLTRDPETHELHHVAHATDPATQLRFGFLRRAIMRHYFLKESAQVRETKQPNA